MSEVDIALDNIGMPLSDWLVITRDYIKLPWYERMHQRMRHTPFAHLSNVLVRGLKAILPHFPGFFSGHYVNYVGYLVTCFTLAHEGTQQELRNSISSPSAFLYQEVRDVLRESQVAVEQARQLLQCLVKLEPELEATVRTRQLSALLLRRIEHFVQGLVTSGALVEADAASMIHSLASDEARLSRQKLSGEQQEDVDSPDRSLVHMNQVFSLAKLQERAYLRARRLQEGGKVQELGWSHRRSTRFGGGPMRTSRWSRRTTGRGQTACPSSASAGQPTSAPSEAGSSHRVAPGSCTEHSSPNSPAVAFLSKVMVVRNDYVSRPEDTPTVVRLGSSDDLPPISDELSEPPRP